MPAPAAAAAAADGDDADANTNTNTTNTTTNTTTTPAASEADRAAVKTLQLALDPLTDRLVLAEPISQEAVKALDGVLRFELLCGCSLCSAAALEQQGEEAEEGEEEGDEAAGGAGPALQLEPGLRFTYTRAAAELGRAKGSTIGCIQGASLPQQSLAAYHSSQLLPRSLSAGGQQQEQPAAAQATITMDLSSYLAATGAVLGRVELVLAGTGAAGGRALLGALLSHMLCLLGAPASVLAGCCLPPCPSNLPGALTLLRAGSPCLTARLPGPAPLQAWRPQPPPPPPLRLPSPLTPTPSSCAPPPASCRSCRSPPSTC